MKVVSDIQKPLPLFDPSLPPYPDSSCRLARPGAPLPGSLRAQPGGPAAQAGVSDLSMLDNNITYQEKGCKADKQLTPFQIRLKRKKNRYYHALLSGLQWNRDQDKYFLTLTSAPDSPGLYQSYNHFVKLVRYASPNYLVKGGYISRKEALKWYQDLDCKFEFEFIKLQTSEGCGVLHIVFTGSRLPISFIRAVWDSIHGARQIVIKHVAKGDTGEKTLTQYLMQQYLYGQDKFTRFSCSAHWIYPGFRRDWEHLVKKMGYFEALPRWKACMAMHRLPGQLDFGGGPVDTPSEKRRYRKNRRKRR